MLFPVISLMRKLIGLKNGSGGGGKWFVFRVFGVWFFRGGEGRMVVAKAVGWVSCRGWFKCKKIK